MAVSREFYIPENSEKVTREGIKAEVYIFNHNNEPCAKGFIGRRSKPKWHYRFPDEESRKDYIAKFFDGLAKDSRYSEAKKAELKAARKEFAEKVTPGFLFYSSWGYDQTNIDFYKALSRKGLMIEVVKVGSKIDHEETGADYVVADPDREIGKVMKKRLNEFGGFTISSYSSARPWDGTPKYETAAGWGH